MSAAASSSSRGERLTAFLADEGNVRKLDEMVTELLNEKRDVDLMKEEEEGVKEKSSALAAASSVLRCSVVPGVELSDEEKSGILKHVEGMKNPRMFAFVDEDYKKRYTPSQLRLVVEERIGIPEEWKPETPGFFEQETRMGIRIISSSDTLNALVDDIMRSFRVLEPHTKHFRQPLDRFHGKDPKLRARELAGQSPSIRTDAGACNLSLNEYFERVWTFYQLSTKSKGCIIADFTARLAHVKVLKSAMNAYWIGLKRFETGKAEAEAAAAAAAATAASE